MRHYEDGLQAAKLANCLQHIQFGVVIQGTGGLVEHDERGVVIERARDCKALP